MSYTDWENVLKGFELENNAEIILKQCNDTKDKLTSLLPYPIKKFEDIDKAMLGSFKKTILAIKNTGEFIIDKEKNNTVFKFKVIPDRMNYVGCFLSSTDYLNHNYEKAFVLNFNQLETFYKTKSIENYVCIVLNPNVAKALKLLIGENASDVNKKISDIFNLVTLNKDLCNKALGLDYRWERLTDSERASSSNWLDKETLNSLLSSLDGIVNGTRNNSTPSCSFAKCRILKQCIKYIEERNKHLVGYCYKPNNFRYRSINVETPLVTDNTLSSIYEKCYNKGNILNSLLQEESYCDVEIAIESFILKYSKVKLNIPLNFSTIMKRYNISLKRLLIASSITKKEKPKYEFSSFESLKKVLNGKFSKYMIFKVDSKYVVYKLKLNNKETLEYTTFSKALMNKYDIEEIDVLDKIEMFKGKVSNQLLGEACLIQTIIEEGAPFIPALKDFYGDALKYKRAVCANNLPVSKLRAL